MLDSLLMQCSGLVAVIVRFIEFSINDPLYDPARTDTQMRIWTLIELSMYTEAACLPTLRPLLHELRKRLGQVQILSKPHLTCMKTNDGMTNFKLLRMKRRQLGQQRVKDEDLDFIMLTENLNTGKQDLGGVYDDTQRA